MDYIERIVYVPERISIYAIKGDSSLVRYIVSTPQTREICNNQQLMGTVFSDSLNSAVEKALIAIPEAHLLEKIPDYENNVVCLLRGSLNFDMRKALARAYNYNNHSTTYLISKREQDNNTKNWFAQVQNYKEIMLTRRVVFWLGDVIRTGESLQRALDTIKKVMFEEKKAYVRVRRFIVFAIGCDNAEKILQEFDEELCRQFQDYEGTILIYFEARFGFATRNDHYPFVKKNTDLLRKDCILTPEFYLSQYDALHYPLERCPLYDGGSRAFDIFSFKEMIQMYWAGMLQEAKKGYTLFDALQNHFPDQWKNKEDFLTKINIVWRCQDKETVEKIWNAHQIRWTRTFIEHAKTSEALKKLCIERLEANAIHVN